MRKTITERLNPTLCIRNPNHNVVLHNAECSRGVTGEDRIQGPRRCGGKETGRKNRRVGLKICGDFGDLGRGRSECHCLVRAWAYLK